MDMIASFKEKAGKQKKRIVFPEGTDERILGSVAKLNTEGFAIPVLVGDEVKVKDAAKKLNLNIDSVEIANPMKSPKLETYAAVYAKRRANEGVTKDIAMNLMRKNLFYGAMMVGEGDGDGMVAGAKFATALVIQAASLAIGYEKGISTPSSFFVMVLPEFQGEKDKAFIFADAAVNIEPTPKQLAEIAVSSGRKARELLGVEPRVAFLSFSTKGSAIHPQVDKVVEAFNIAKTLDAGLLMDGEFQADTALVARVAAKKLKAPSEVAGKANVLIFPDLNSGNIAYKLTQYLANAKAFGPFLQGFAKPLSDLSRGASVDDIVGVTAVVAAQG